MLLTFSRMRVGARRLAAGTLLMLPLAACSGGDLLLPDDRRPAQLRAFSGDGQAAPVGSPVPNPLVVEALDGAGRPVEGAVVVFEFVDPPTGAAIAPPVSATDPLGLARVEVTLGRPPGDQPVDARLDDPERDLSVRFLLTAIPSNTGGEGDDNPPPDDDSDDGGSGGGGGPPVDEGGGDGGGGGGGGEGDDDGGNDGGGTGGGGDDGTGGGGNGDDGDDGEGDGGNRGGDNDGGDEERDDNGDDNSGGGGRDDDEGEGKGKDRDDNSGRGNGDDDD